MNVNPSPVEKAPPKVKSKKAQLKLVVGGHNPAYGPKSRYSRGGLGFAISVSLHILVVGLAVYFSSSVSSPALIADSPKGEGLSLFPGMEISIDNSLSEGASSGGSPASLPPVPEASAETAPKEQENTPPPTSAEQPPLEKAPIQKVKKEPQPVKIQPVKKIVKPDNTSKETKPIDSEQSEANASSNQNPSDNIRQSSNNGTQAVGGKGGGQSDNEPRPGGGGSLDTPVSYQQAIAAHLSRHKRYPEQARMRGLEGQVTISLTLGKGGDVRDFQIINSDSDILSGGAKSMVERASPFPNIPDDMAADFITLKLPIKFNLY